MAWHFLLSYLLVLAVLAYSAKAHIGGERALLIGSLRAAAQLGAMGYALVWVFTLKAPPVLFAVLGGMILFAAYTAQERVRVRPMGMLVALAGIATASGVVIGSLLILGILTSNANELIPISGMVIGNAMNVYSLTVEQLKKETVARILELEAKVALGASLQEAMHPYLQSAVKGALIPITNNLKTVGVVWIPGMMTGMLVAGADPLLAVSYQLVVMYMILAVSLLAGVLAVKLVYGKMLSTTYPGKKESRGSV